MLNVEDLDNYEAIDFLREGTFGREYAERLSLNPHYLPAKLEADKHLVRTLAEAKEQHPEEMQRLFDESKDVARKIRKMGIREWLFERKRGVGEFALFTLAMLLLLPLFGTSIGATWAVFLFPLLVNHLFIKDKQFRGSINLAVTLLVTYPLFGLVPVVVMLCSGAWLSAVGYLVGFPLMMIFASNYMRWAQKWLGYARFVFGDKKATKKLAIRRLKLYKELGKIVK